MPRHMGLIDSHAHLNDSAFAPDIVEVIARAREAGVQSIINVGYDLNSSKRAVELAEEYGGFWAVVGVHPHDARTWTLEIDAWLRQMAGHKRVLAIGEIGLDYYYDHSPREEQRQVFTEQMALAREVGLPVVIHSREAAKDTLDIVGEFPENSCLLHCYSGSLEMAKVYEKLDCYFSFGGPITFQNAHKLREVVVGIPIERILLETDCPYLTPHPHRGKRNEPAYLGLVAEKLAEIHSLPIEEIVRITAQNTRKFFRVDDKEDVR